MNYIETRFPTKFIIVRNMKINLVYGYNVYLKNINILKRIIFFFKLKFHSSKYFTKFF